MSIQYILDILGTGFFAMSGAIVANQKSKPDWFGVSFIGFVTSIGGGSMRDVLLGSYPLSWVADVNRLYAIIGAVVITSVFFDRIVRLKKTLFIFDALGIAMFTILGTEKALLFHVNPFIAAILGMFSAVFGGILRDILTNEVPIIFRKEIYATACLAGALIYLGLITISPNRNMALLVSIAVILVIRILAVRYDLSLPQFKRDYHEESVP